MTNLALRLETETTPLFAFSRVVQNPSVPPAFIVEDHEIERLAFAMPYVKALPYSAFVDDRGRVHFEINHSSYYPSKSVKTFLKSAVKPDKYFYDLLRTQIIGGSLIKNERRLIGGAICTFYGDTKTTEVKLLGTLPREETLDVAPEIRRQAANLLIKWHHPLLRWLGGIGTHTTPCVIPVEKMKKNGWVVKDMTFKEKLEKFKDGLPMSLIKRQNIFIDRDYETNCRNYPATGKCTDCKRLSESNLKGLGYR